MKQFTRINTCYVCPQIIMKLCAFLDLTKFYADTWNRIRTIQLARIAQGNVRLSCTNFYQIFLRQTSERNHCNRPGSVSWTIAVGS